MDSKGALAELKNFQGTRKSAGDYYTQAQGELGVGDAKTRQDDLRGLIRNTETALKGVGQSVAGRTRGNLVTEAQRSRLQALETQPIAQQLSDRQGEFSDAQTNYRDLLSQAGQRAGMSYQTDADRQNSLQSIYDRLYGQEQAQAEADRAARDFEERRRQFDATMAENRNQFNQQLANTRNQFASQASLGAQSRTDAARAAALEAELARQRNIKTTGNKAASDLAKVNSQPKDFYNSLNPFEKYIGGVGNSFSNILKRLGI